MKADNSVWAWGKNDRGQVGVGDFNNRSTSTMTLLNGTQKMIVSSISQPRAFAVGSDGSAWGWGYGLDGGRETTICCLDLATPDRIQGLGGIGTLSGVNSIAGGGEHTLALLENGDIVVWGRNGEGQYGVGTTQSGSDPQIGPTIPDVAALAAGRYHSVALTFDGLVWAWGTNWL